MSLSSHFCFNKMDKLSRNYDAIVNENRKLEQEFVFISAVKEQTLTILNKRC